MTLSDGLTELDGVVQDVDVTADIALVRVTPQRPLAAAKLGSSASLSPGQFVIALGSPAGLSNSLSLGVVSALARTRSEIGLHDAPGARNGTQYIQVDAAINSGNSGGPLVNLEGEVVGVNTMKAMEMDGIAFALPIDAVKRVVDQLRRHGRVLRPYLGLKFVELDPTIAAELRRRASPPHGPAEAGLYVMHVAPDSPAQRAGVHVGDTIVTADRADVRTMTDLNEILQRKAGGKVTLGVQRADRRLSVRCGVDVLP